MHHLDAERLAALDHLPPTEAEVAHLAACATCRADRAAHERLARLAAEARHPADPVAAPRLLEWGALAAALRTEGLLRLPSAESAPDEPVVVHALPGGAAVADARPGIVEVATPVSAPRGPRAVPTRAFATWQRVAAALVLVLGGAVFGRVTSGWPPATAGGEVLADVAAAPVGSAADFASVQQATDVLARAQRDYERASLWLAANDTTVYSSDVYRARLAALDQMMATSRLYLRDAPQDPVLNQYYLAAYAAREATLQQLGGALPVDKALDRF